MKRYGFIWIFAALALGSCSTGPDMPVPADGNDKSVRFSLKISSADGSRALGEADENTVHTIDVLAFSQDAQGVYRYAYAATEIRRSDMTVTATVKGYSSRQQFVILVNGSDELSSAGIGLNEPLDDALRKIVCAKGIDGLWNARNNGAGDFDHIPMYARTDPVVVDENNKQIGPYPMLRMLARIDVRVRADVSGFKLLDARLFNQKTAGYVAYDFSGFATDRVHTAAVPAANANTGDPILSGSVAYAAAHDVDAKGVIERSIYTYESPAYGESGRLTGTAVVVRGEYFGVPGYYRVNLKTADETDHTRLSSHILRNHLYKVEIESVSGPGYGSAEEAYLGDSRLTATVTEWSMARQSVTDGRWWLSVSGDSWECPAEGGGFEIIAVSNYSVDWLGFPSGLQVDASKIVYTPAVAPDEEWITIENVSGENGSPARKFNIVASGNLTRKNRSAKVYVTAGNLSKAIHVAQGYNAPEWAGTSNCYMIKTGDTSPLSIPMTQVLVAMGSRQGAPDKDFLGTGWITDYGKLKAQVLWSDVNKFGTADAVVRSVTYIGANVFSDSEIVVIPGSAEGNSGIILYQDNNNNGVYNSGDKIIWSWHIWNTPYHPYNEDGTPNGMWTGDQALTNTDWMDRNLGAKSNTTYGLFYQWGRKDPFAGNLNRYYSVSVTDKTLAPSGPNLSLSVMNPATLYYSGIYNINDWFTTSSVNQNATLWGGGGATDFLHLPVNGHRKSVYDPCPDGYRLPRDTEWSDKSWTKQSGGFRNNNYGGFFPFTGRHKASDGAYDGSTGNYWSASPYVYGGNTNRGSMINFSYQSSSPGLGAEFRAAGYNIRCRTQ